MSMRRPVCAAIIVICIGMPLVELFDSWDRTVEDGNDTESNVVLVALCVGLALSTAATVVVTSVPSSPIDLRFRLPLEAPVLSAVPVLLTPLQTGSPPPTPLRV
ncbi:MAG: hypothetical protein ABI880_09335 [Acidobacteriota bacterium]